MKRFILVLFIHLLFVEILFSVNKISSRDLVYMSVDVPAAFEGNIAGFNEYVRNFVRHPDYEFAKNIQGKVYVKFIVRKDATIDSLTIYKGLTENLNNEAIRLIRNVDAWRPALIKNKPVSSYLVYPVDFRTTDSVSTSIRLKDVLVELDGRRMSPGINVNLINPDLIESGVYIKPYPIQVRDSLQALYGAKAKNGLLKISTFATNYYSPAYENNKFCVIGGDTVYKTVDVLSVDSNSVESLYDYLINYTGYPLLAQKLNLQGCVFINIILDETGKVEDILFLKNSNPYFSKILRATLVKSPLWKPLFIDGKAVKSMVSFPVSFYANNAGVYVVSKEQLSSEIKDYKCKLMQSCGANLGLDMDLALINEAQIETINVNPIVSKDGSTNDSVIVNVCPKMSNLLIKTTKVYIPRLQSQMQSADLKDDLVVDTTLVFDIIEQMPEFPGGDKALFEYLSSNIRYPVLCQENRISGRVITRFVVSADGSVKDVEILKSPDSLLSQEAIRLIDSMPKWIPGMQKGKRVGVYFTLPINFKLQ